MKKNLLIGMGLISSFSFGQTTIKDTLFYTGSEQTWTVPCGASNVTIETYGAKGATGSTANPGVNVGGAAGLGNKVTGNWSSLNPNDVIYVFVGGKANGHIGGFNGGGNGVANPAAYPSGGGGGATDIRFPTNAINDRIQVAGGGGGGGNASIHALTAQIVDGDGGNGGGNQLLYGNSLDGQSGENSSAIENGDTSPNDFLGAGGGTSAAVGAAGVNGCVGFFGEPGNPANGAIGGNGGQGFNQFGNTQTVMASSGGGGGGGHTGGNGGGGGSLGSINCMGNGEGAGGGGAAGSNYFDGPITGENGVNDGDGFVVISYTYDIDTAVIDENFNTPCVGESVLIFGNPGNGTYNVLSGPAVDMNDGELTPSIETTYVITYSTSSCGVTTTDTVTVVIDCTLGLNENSLNTLSIYPNPTSSSLTIENALNANIRIFDNTGKVVQTINNNQTIQISVAELVEGLYFIELEKNGLVQNARFVKE
ncbi:MAG: T9SS type A sorting domain-containing protein [Fluviicola sp.]|nr:T9SS type A sorting domain-containing protein [Fluviicola sp.]